MIGAHRQKFFFLCCIADLNIPDILVFLFVFVYHIGSLIILIVPKITFHLVYVYWVPRSGIGTVWYVVSLNCFLAIITPALYQPNLNLTIMLWDWLTLSFSFPGDD